MMASDETLVLPSLSRLLRRMYDAGALKVVYRTGCPPAYELIDYMPMPEDCPTI